MRKSGNELTGREPRVSFRGCDYVVRVRRAGTKQKQKSARSTTGVYMILIITVLRSSSLLNANITVNGCPSTGYYNLATTCWLSKGAIPLMALEMDVGTLDDPCIQRTVYCFSPSNFQLTAPTSYIA